MRASPDAAFGPGGEFAAIRRFLDAAPGGGAGVVVGPGDDALVLEGGWVLSTDLFVEDVHFRPGWIGEREAGYRAAAAALSDLAAMAADITGALVSLALPRGRGEAYAAEVMDGVSDALRACGGALLGGDVTRSPGPLALDVVVVGRAQRPLLRSGARYGDEIWVTGVLGGAAAAVAAWRDGEAPVAAARARFARPVPRLAEAVYLRDVGGARAAIDLSDGLAGDAGHLAAASQVCIDLSAASVPVDVDATAGFADETAADLALRGGEDYELCVAVPPGGVDPAAFRERFGIPLTRVGRVTEGEGRPGVRLLREGAAPERLSGGGYDHLGEGGGER